MISKCDLMGSRKGDSSKVTEYTEMANVVQQLVGEMLPGAAC